MPWTWILIAGLFEITWAIGLKYSHGFTRPWPSVITAGAMVLSYIFLAMGVKTLPVGTAYAVWTGIGVAGTAILGMLWLHEPRDAGRIACLLLIVTGILGLRLLTRE